MWQLFYLNFNLIIKMGVFGMTIIYLINSNHYLQISNLTIKVINFHFKVNIIIVIINIAHFNSGYQVIKTDQKYHTFKVIKFNLLGQQNQVNSTQKPTKISSILNWASYYFQKIRRQNFQNLNHSQEFINPWPNQLIFPYCQQSFGSTFFLFL
ncbi:hypothetical protein PPERSA_12129 [Pseudocohnilembus persalinus]|uniref:Transmembrane protein n=1 Tax=Pseudocohnilembus persalinus TaxID=266149 RepID=A0A0V0QP09_PSEPJ|nr:hypothetical protein PPERSA_12129 [Pseudocohnilembus persalinus]|eukprot:KRX03924.1 hypothetical protein PPERSA_12129 [Pseudocohnilembus persalinus]